MSQKKFQGKGTRLQAEQHNWHGVCDAPTCGATLAASGWAERETGLAWIGKHGISPFLGRDEKTAERPIRRGHGAVSPALRHRGVPETPRHLTTFSRVRWATEHPALWAGAVLTAENIPGRGHEATGLLDTRCTDKLRRLDLRGDLGGLGLGRTGDGLGLDGKHEISPSSKVGAGNGKTSRSLAEERASGAHAARKLLARGCAQVARRG